MTTIRDIMYPSVGTRRGVSPQSAQVGSLDTDIILAHVLKKSREFLYSNPDYNLTSLQLKRFQALVQRRQQGEPIAYLTGLKEFYGLEFKVNHDVLIPRPDTELLVEHVIASCGKKPFMIADIGTGSGNIAVSLKHHLSACTVIATDISKPALQVAQQNAKNNHTKITFYQGDVLRALPKTYHHKINVLIFNPPYLTKTESRKKNLAFEPQIALTPPGTPTSIMELFFQQAGMFLAPHGSIFMEMGHRQGKQVQQLAAHYLPMATFKVIQDLGHYDRLVILALA